MNLDAIGIVSKDIPASVKFYGLLGIKLVERGSADHFEGTASNGLRLMLDSTRLMKQLNPDWKPPVGGGVILCFKQETAAKVDEVFKAITTAGFKGLKTPWDAFWGQRYASVFDPDGNQVDIFAQL